MSGGVDSAVTLLKAGPTAVGVTLRLWIDPLGPDVERACCSPAAVIAARETCHSRGLPHVTLDLREQFRRVVVEPFVAGYAAGATPNPCVSCNGNFRFDELLAFTDRIGAVRLATGHYVRMVERHGVRALARAHDATKDQSYMLASFDPNRLDRLWFPLGEQTKAQTRAEAEAAGLAAAARAESQEACFLGGGDYRDFLDRAGLKSKRGALVDEQGGDGRQPRRVLAFHAGAAQGSRCLRRRASLCDCDRRTNEHGGRWATARAGATSCLRSRPPRRQARAGRRQASLPLAGRSCVGRTDRRRLRSPPGRACLRRCSGADSCALRR